MANPQRELGFDPDGLRERYRIERDKRLREDGNDQYIEVTGEFAHYVEDPYLEEEIRREPLTDEIDITHRDEAGILLCNLATMQGTLKAMLDEIRTTDCRGVRELPVQKAYSSGLATRN